MSDLEESYVPPSLVEDNLAVPDAGLQRVESYVNPQQRVTHEPSQYNSSIEDRGVTGQLDRQTDSQIDLRTLNNVSTENPQPNLVNGVQGSINTLHNQHTAHSVHTDINTCSELAKIFGKKDFVAKTHLFEDNAENFSSWKASFKNAVRELSLSPSEEMDLLIQWLGNTSSANRQRVSGMQMHRTRILNRLDDRFANPEVVESSIKKKLARFPKLGNKDYAKLYELLDIVTEIDSLKENPTYSTLLTYFDSSSGVNPIVAKLPHSIQEKWITEASNHKLRSGTPYPAFPLFVAFLEKITRIKNDPSLQFDTAQDANRCKQLRAFPGRTQGRKNSPTVSAFKTQVRVQNSGVYYDDSIPAPDCCPIHEKSKHSLNKCRSFRLRPLDERRTFIKENGHCFRCCGPRKHIRTKCRETVLFSVCKATDHPSALHQYLAASLATRKNHEGEKPPVISSICTHICGKPANTSKSCA